MNRSEVINLFISFNMYKPMIVVYLQSLSSTEVTSAVNNLKEVFSSVLEELAKYLDVWKIYSQLWVVEKNKQVQNIEMNQDILGYFDEKLLYYDMKKKDITDIEFKNKPASVKWVLLVLLLSYHVNSIIALTNLY